MIRLWQRMTEIYGHRWVSSYGSTPNDSWVAALGEMPAGELKTGLDTMLKECLQWPPTLTEFISYCKPPRVDPIHTEYQLPAPSNICREEGRKKSAKLIAMMKGEKE